MTQARDLMQALPTERLNADWALSDAATLFAGVSAMPVYTDLGTFLGLITHDSFAAVLAAVSDPEHHALRDYTLRTPTVSPDADLAEVIELLTRSQSQLLTVTEGGTPLGLITLDAALRELRQQAARQAAMANLGAAKIRIRDSWRESEPDMLRHHEYRLEEISPSHPRIQREVTLASRLINRMALGVVIAVVAFLLLLLATMAAQGSPGPLVGVLVGTPVVLLAIRLVMTLQEHAILRWRNWRFTRR